LGLVAVVVLIPDPLESVVALPYLPWDFLFLGLRGVALRGGFKLTRRSFLTFESGGESSDNGALRPGR
jgi:hypothetical protein